MAEEACWTLSNDTEVRKNGRLDDRIVRVTQEPGLTRMIRICYEALGLLSFFTVGPDEVRAWTVREGSTAPQAAGAIHSDLERGFIRAEVIAYEDLARVETMPKAREQGLLRTEGKDYKVRDGDILNIRFSV